MKLDQVLNVVTALCIVAVSASLVIPIQRKAEATTKFDPSVSQLLDHCKSVEKELNAINAVLRILLSQQRVGSDQGAGRFSKLELASANGALQGAIDVVRSLRDRGEVTQAQFDKFSSDVSNNILSIEKAYGIK